MDVTYSVIEAMAKQISAIIDYLGNGSTGGGGTGNIEQQLAELRKELEELKKLLGNNNGQPLQSQIDDLRNLILQQQQQHATDMATVSQAIASLQTRISALESTVNGHTTEITNIKLTLDQHSASIAQIPDMKQAITTLQTTVGSIQTQVNTNTSDITQLKNNLNSIEGPFLALQQQVNQNTVNINGLNQRLEALETPGTDTDAVTVQQFNALVARVTTNETNISTAQTNITTLDVRVTALENQNSNNDFDTRLNALTSRMNVAEGRIQNNAADIQLLTERLNGLTAFETDFTNLQNAVNQLTTRMNTAEGNITNLNGLTASLAGDISAIQTILTTHTETINQHGVDIEGILQRLNNLEAGTGGGIDESAFNALVLRVTALEGQVTGIKTDLAEAQQNIVVNTSSINRIRTTVDDHEQRILELERKVASLESSSGGSITTAQLDKTYLRLDSAWGFKVTDFLTTIQAYLPQIQFSNITLNSDGWLPLPNENGPVEGSVYLTMTPDSYETTSPESSNNSLFAAVNVRSAANGNSRASFYWTSNTSRLSGAYKAKIYFYVTPPYSPWGNYRWGYMKFPYQYENGSYSP